MAEILLEGMEFFAYHGYYDEEQNKGNDFVVDVRFSINTSEAEISDKLEDTLNYEEIFVLVKDEMEITSSLLENVAYRIKKKIEHSFPYISDLKVSVAKKNPPIKGNIKQVRVIL